MASHWQSFPVLLFNDESPLLFKWAFDLDRYVIHVTDLHRTWTETLQKEDIIQRAHDMRCPLDPEDGDSQLRQLLEKVEDALRGAKDTTISAFLGAAGKELSISSMSHLPKPLSPVRWSMYLSRMPDDAMRVQIIQPLVETVYTQKRQIEELERMLREKDTAIAKTLDKVESLGIELSNIFPLAGKSRTKVSRRSHIFKHVRGLSPFDKDSWHTEFVASSQAPPALDRMLKIAFPGGKSRSLESVPPDVSLSGSTTSGKPRDEEGLVERSRGLPSEQARDESQPDEFQRQATPSRPDTTQSAHAFAATKDDVINDSTTDDESGDISEHPSRETSKTSSPRQFRPIIPQSSLEPSVSSPRTPGGRKLGVISQRKETQGLSGVEEQQISRIEAPTGSMKTSDHIASSGSKRQSPPGAVSTGEPRKKLGKVGGRAKISNHTMASPMDLEAPKTTTATAGRPESSGSTAESSAMEGVRHEKFTSRNEGKEEQQTVSAVLPKEEKEEEQEEEESKEARADRKRAELKREMAEKSKAAASKKKRRF